MFVPVKPTDPKKGHMF